MISWPEELVDDLARRRCVIFIGAGVSMNSLGEDGKTRPPNWNQFLQKAFKLANSPKHIKRLLAEGDLLTACELLKQKLGDDFRILVEREFVAPRYKHADIHEAIFKLDARIILTQNFDKIYDSYAQITSKNSVRVKTHYDGDVADFLRGGQSVILKAHGTIDTPTKMVFTRREYSDARYSHAAFYALIEALAVTHSFLFLGCGLADPDVKLLLERVAYFFRVSKAHYMCMPKIDGGPHKEVLKSIRENLGLRALTYAPDGAHTELTTSIQQLIHLVEGRRKEMAAVWSW